MGHGEVMCPVCGDVFEAIRSTRQTCGDRCRQAMHRAKVKAERVRIRRIVEEDLEAEHGHIRRLARAKKR